MRLPEEKCLYHLEEALWFKMPTNEGVQEMMDSIMEGDELGAHALKSVSIQLQHDLQQDSTLQGLFGQTAFSKTVGNTESSTLNHKRMLESIHNSRVYQACNKGQEMHEWKPDPNKANKPTPVESADDKDPAQKRAFAFHNLRKQLSKKRTEEQCRQQLEICTRPLQGHLWTHSVSFSH